eukprot:COSAG03_NODE_8171_length_825_cov_1.612859_1_plen_195_part_00
MRLRWKNHGVLSNTCRPGTSYLLRQMTGGNCSQVSPAVHRDFFKKCMYVWYARCAGPAAERRARSARARRAVARSDRDGPVRKRFSNWTVAVRRCERPVKCVSCVYLCPVPGPRTLIFRLPGADKHALLELLAALAPLLSQRPSHPTDRPDPGRPRPALLPLHAVVRARNGCCSLPRGCSAPHCWSCKCWTGAS